jgi:hypothetical protein
MKLTFKWLGVLLFALMATTQMARAETFRPGEQVMVFLPSPDIQNDAFIVGIIKGRLPDGRYRIKVTDYVKGHDYGLSCEPLPPANAGSEYGKGWEKWDDTRRLDPNIEYAVPADKLMPVGKGHHYAISRNNVWTRFARWLSDAPVLYVEDLEQARKELKALGLDGLDVPFQLAIAHRKTFYSPLGSPYWPHEVLPRLVPLLDRVQAVLDAHPELKKAYFAKPRPWDSIRKSTFMLFTLRAIDKIVHDAHYVLYEEDAEKNGDPKTIEAIKQRLRALGVRVN